VCFNATSLEQVPCLDHGVVSWPYLAPDPSVPVSMITLSLSRWTETGRLVSISLLSLMVC
jgi:hypothetical protein